jgi:hypothetical protein
VAPYKSRLLWLRGLRSLRRACRPRSLVRVTRRDQPLGLHQAGSQDRPLTAPTAQAARRGGTKAAFVGQHPRRFPCGPRAPPSHAQTMRTRPIPRPSSTPRSPRHRPAPTGGLLPTEWLGYSRVWGPLGGPVREAEEGTNRGDECIPGSKRGRGVSPPTHTSHRHAFLRRHTPPPPRALRPTSPWTISRSLSPPAGVLCTLPSWYLCAIRFL